MRNRGVGGGLVALWLVASISCFAQGVLLYLDEEPLSFSAPVLQQDAFVLVPLEEFCCQAGLELSVSEDDVVLRGPGIRQQLKVSSFFVEDGILYVSLNEAIDWISAKIHQVGGAIYLVSSPPLMVDIVASPTEVTVRLTAFSCHEMAVSQQGLSQVVNISWPHTQLALPAQLIRLGESDIQSARLADFSSETQLMLTLEAGTILSTIQLETDEFYAVTFRVEGTQAFESVIEMSDGITVYEGKNASGSLSYIYVDTWRDRFRLHPAVPSSGYQSSASLQSILQDDTAVAALSLDCHEDAVAPECLIMDGIPYVISSTPSAVLAMDLFGRWSTFSSLCDIFVKHAGQSIPVEGVGRPLGYGEVVIYPPGYDADIVRGIPGSFSAIKIRDKRVVSVYQGPFVPEDPSALLLVASGEAKARLASIKLGDAIDVVCQFVHAEGTYPYAVSAGPQVLGNGVLLAGNDVATETASLRGGTMLACDWQGGLYLLAYEGRLDTELGQGGMSLEEILHSLPTTIKDAVLLSTCERGGLAYATGDGAFQLGAQEPIRLALCLIPVTP